MRLTTRSLILTGAVVMSCASMLACGSENSAEPGDTPPSSAGADASAAQLVGPDEFAERIDQPEVVTINVHVPDEGNIAGTDEVIPFDQITDADALPDDLDTPLAVYCRSGNMSADAVRDLAAMGYTDIVELEGGFNAWVESGRELDPPST